MTPTQLHTAALDLWAANSEPTFVDYPPAPYRYWTAREFESYCSDMAVEYTESTSFYTWVYRGLLYATPHDDNSESLYRVFNRGDFRTINGVCLGPVPKDITSKVQVAMRERLVGANLTDYDWTQAYTRDELQTVASTIQGHVSPVYSAGGFWYWYVTDRELGSYRAALPSNLPSSIVVWTHNEQTRIYMSSSRTTAYCLFYFSTLETLAEVGVNLSPPTDERLCTELPSSPANVAPALTELSARALALFAHKAQNGLATETYSVFENPYFVFETSELLRECYEGLGPHVLVWRDTVWHGRTGNKTALLAIVQSHYTQEEADKICSASSRYATPFAAYLWGAPGKYLNPPEITNMQLQADGDKYVTYKGISYWLYEAADDKVHIRTVMP